MIKLATSKNSICLIPYFQFCSGFWVHVFFCFLCLCTYKLECLFVHDVSFVQSIFASTRILFGQRIGIGLYFLLQFLDLYLVKAIYPCSDL
jgi:hypothetical protein